ncbi:MAG: pyrroline-5-carboxylate reductase [Candidatus Brocadiia bacterium]
MIERKVGFCGAGLMAEALMKGMLDAGVARAENLYAADPDAARRELFAERLGDNVFTDNLDVAEACGVVVLSVKPGVVPVVAAEVGDHLTARHLVVSIAAGVTLGSLREMLGTDRVVRVMPNTPALVGAGAAAYCTGADVTAEDAELVEEMLGAVGTCVRVGEKHMDAVTGLSGSGPAYLYMTIEALSDGGVLMGLPREVATKLAAQTVLGAAKMVLETGEHPGALKDQVTTPGGTTIEAVRALEDAGLRRAFIEAVAAATEKCARLTNDA